MDFYTKEKAAEAGEGIRGVRQCKEQDGVSQGVARLTDKIVLRLTAKAPLRGDGTFSLLGGEVPIFFFAIDSKLTWPQTHSAPQANSTRLSYARSARSYNDFPV